MHAQVEPHHQVLIVDALAVEELAVVLLGMRRIIDFLNTIHQVLRIVIF